MITPRFDVTQDDEFVIVTMRVPYIKVADMEYSIVETQFTFYAKPYFLRLTFPHTIVEDGREKAQYDIDKGTLVVRLPKETKGQFFDGLDMLTQLLARKKPAKQGNPLIEVISGNEDTVEDDDEEDFDWEQTVPDPDQPVLLGLTKNKYGFNKQYSEFFEDLQEDLSEIVSITNPDDAPSDTWRSERIRLEDDKFDPEHYMADFMMDSEIKELLAFKTQSSKDLRRKLVLKKKRKAEAAQAVQLTTSESNGNTPSQEAPSKPDASTQDTTSIDTPVPSSQDPPIVEASAPLDTQNTTPITPAAPDTQDAPPPSAVVTPPPDTETRVEHKPESIPLESQASASQSTSSSHLTPASLAFLTPTSITSSSFLASSSPSLSSSDAATTGVTTSLSPSTTMAPNTSTNNDITKQNRDEDIVQFSDENKEVLMRLPSKECESSIESAWTICTLSSTLSCLETFHSLQGALIASIRRALAHWGLTQQILKDTTIIFRLGKRAVVRALLDIHKLLEMHDTKRHLNSLYITDYCIWAQKLGRSKFKSIYQKLKNLQISKDLIGWPLDYLEQRAREEFMPDAE